MIPAPVFRERLNTHCKNCEFWKGVCLKGHTLQGPMGCPLKKFPPVEGADYLPDLPLPQTPAPRMTPCCGNTDTPLTEMTWPEVFSHFRSAVQAWQEAGFPLTPDDVYQKRIETCKNCPRYRWFQCRVCKCIVYTKAKLQTETCPEGRWTE